MTRLPSLKARDVLRALEATGFVLRRTSGSHHILRHPDGRIVVVPYHGGRDIKQGTLRSILHQSGLTVNELIELI